MTQSGHRSPQVSGTPWRVITAVLNCVGGAPVIRSGHNKNDKAKPAERRGRKATGPRFLREAMDDSPKDPKIAELPQRKSVRGQHYV